jgi:hypothetical protein
VSGGRREPGLNGGIYLGGAVNLRGSILAGNTNDFIVDTAPNFSGDINSLGYNVIGSLGTPPYDTPYTAHPTDQVGVTDAQLNLGPLAANGGPVPTHALGAGSVAIDKGHGSGATADQRGLTRPCDLAAVSNAAGGDGSDSGAFEVQGVCGGPAPPPPDAAPDAAVVAEDSGANAVGVLANDTDIDGPALSAVLVGGPAHASAFGLNADGSFSYTPLPGFNGVDAFVYKADDGPDDSNLATVTITVKDKQGPAITCAVAKALLWPPNSDLVNVGLSVTATDNDGEQPSVRIDVFSDEDDEEQVGGMSPDAKDVGASTLRLRAERPGDADGRVYVIRIKATDQSNNTSYGYCTVVVPHGQSKASLSAVNAQAAAAVAAFVSNGNNPPAGLFLVGDGPAVGPKQ